MVRRATPKPVTAQMYRHFAVFTVAVTAAIGIFADGESRKAVAREVAPAPRATLAGPTELARPAAAPPGSFAADDGFDGTFGAPMDSVGAAAQVGFVPDLEQPGSNAMPTGFTRYGVTEQVWAGLSESQRAALIAKHKAAERSAAAPERTTQVSSLLAASQMRAGEATVGE